MLNRSAVTTSATPHHSLRPMTPKSDVRKSKALLARGWN
jgi:hypothetical protein